MGISSKHSPSNIWGACVCACARDWEESQMQKQNPWSFCLFAFLNTDYMYSGCWQPFWKPLKTPVSICHAGEWWLEHRFVPCVMHKVNQAILLDYSKLWRLEHWCSRVSKNFISCIKYIPWLLTLLNDTADLGTDEPLSSIGKSSVLMAI